MTDFARTRRKLRVFALKSALSSAAAVLAVLGLAGPALAAPPPRASVSQAPVRHDRPKWLMPDGTAGPAVFSLLRQLDTAAFDGVKRSKLKTGAVEKALARAKSGNPQDIAKAEQRLSQSFATYVRLMRAAPQAPMQYESAALRPVIPTEAAVLQAAAAQADLAKYVERMGWMHPLYAPTRQALESPALSQMQRQAIVQNLARIRALPASPADRYVLVDAASARLWMYEKDRQVGSMRVVVGKPQSQTPMMAGFLRFAIGNPYWNVPTDLVQKIIAPNVHDKGLGYLSGNGYQVLSDWTDQPRIVAPQTVDWNAVMAGTTELRVRQLPGGSNFMGKVKFEFPNPQGIYLHDTPDKHLLALDQRQLSNGCVRLEDADRFGRWLLGRPLPRRFRAAEQRIDLPRLVPIYITYLTAMPQNGQVAFQGDVYGRDATRIARRN